MQKITARVAPEQPYGHRYRAGLLFVKETQEYAVTASQLEAIEADPYIIVVSKEPEPKPKATKSRKKV